MVEPKPVMAEMLISRWITPPAALAVLRECHWISLAAFPAFDAMRQALPMVQALLLMAIYVMLPLILAFGSYEFKTVITVSFVVFALNFLTFWWELARWLDSWLMEALYSSDTHSRRNAAGFQNSSDDFIMNFVMGRCLLC